ncbi:hypothetical protein [Aestuariivivens sediminicola]|uniref:hypothetical protein n=1 Tax=Aestuariivivens sediminicola TaxID=2913560 RepID=UPI001F5A0501|nr:hypothetical protein [Aestuariivivens sediminicola]
MKHWTLLLVLLFSGFTAIAQNLNAGLSAGWPIGDKRQLHSFNLTAEINYLWEISEIFEVGISTGYSFYPNSDKHEYSEGHISYLPISAATRFNVSQKFILGLDLGGTVLISGESIFEGVYAAPKLQYRITESYSVVVALRSLIYDVIFGGSRDLLSIGLEFKIL